MEGRGGQPEGDCHRQTVDAVLYVIPGGIAWRAVPKDFPAWDRVHAFFRRWRDCGLVAGPTMTRPRTPTSTTCRSSPSALPLEPAQSGMTWQGWLQGAREDDDGRHRSGGD
ncbi:transposase [Kitasatospora sp. NPDC086801]|uniref:transposase n=1 Tax=Kitasatospora sp. NPDC086801 TaxID=3364066 RepID=UPI0037FF3304